ncbi:hypothetical protein CRG98_005689 [Punica granatum]|uniref:Bet v I/Major latex protein domain-containing protein n=1 Tax=Punica granatum TaxID=22663 RepID=A0A2I0KZL4_PUNGR|nr:hypothetical protein CRG98_005689 [Punica granatum]
MASPEALCGKLQKDIELKSSAAHYYKLWRKETHKIPTASSPNIQAVYFQCGTWNRNPCSHSYYDGKPAVFKEKVEFNDANMTITIHGIEGDLYNELKFYRLTIKGYPEEQWFRGKAGHRV